MAKQWNLQDRARISRFCKTLEKENVIADVKRNKVKMLTQCKSILFIAKCWQLMQSRFMPHRVSISSTFYARIFRTKANWAAFLLLRFGFGERISSKSTFVRKTLSVNFINVLRAAFAPEDSKRAKDSQVISSVFLCFWRVARKTGEIDPE